MKSKIYKNKIRKLFIQQEITKTIKNSKKTQKFFTKLKVKYKI
jgi:hypothetical protein